MEECAYSNALDAVRLAGEKDIGPYDMCVAFEIKALVDDAAKKMSKRSRARNMLEHSAPKLFCLACDVVRMSAGAETPADAARGVVESFVELGMDFDRTAKYVKSFRFAAHR